MEDSELILLFYPSAFQHPSYKRRPDYEAVKKELAKRPKKYGEKINTGFLRYREADPATALGRTHYFALVRNYLKKSKLAFRFRYEPGEIMACDFSGMKVHYRDLTQQREVSMDVLVVAFGHSQKMYAVALHNMSAKNWIRGLVEVIHAEGGCTPVIRFDNAQLVNRAGLLPALNEQAITFSRYYNLACDTSRVGMPRDNAIAEKSVQFIENRVLVPMRNLEFTSALQVNQHLRAEIEKLNNEKMQNVGLSRNEKFYQAERQALLPIPAKPYRPVDKYCPQTVSPNYSVRLNGHKYSVPHKYRNRKVTLEVRDNELTVVLGAKTIATHTISNEVGGETVIEHHKHPIEKAEDQKNVTAFTQWAEPFGPYAVKVVAAQYCGKKSSRSRFAGKACTFIQKLARGYTPSEFERACQYAVEHEMTKPEDLSIILKSSIFDDDDEQNDSAPILQHQNIRGKDHYGVHRYE
ncbi:putative transposase y4bL/y4kJ/y4tB [Alteromonas halophila]|uniref:Transposase y4bL/y4kJ/y4tB n=2 Tax=Alteromonas halophila TaxID=516698 RepID=A0A918JLA4_9ALTE|nr:putative transposase y4bL/y4kJ/y4tB [Alteromonas halophila]